MDAARGGASAVAHPGLPGGQVPEAKKRRGADVWLRADELIHHSGAELAAARAAANAANAAMQAAGVFEAGRCASTACTLGAGHAGLCSHLRATGKRRRA